MFRPLLLLAAAAATLLAASDQKANAFERVGSTLYSGVFHLAPGQVAQVTIGNLGGPDTLPSSCAARVSFYGAGRRLVRAQN